MNKEAKEFNESFRRVIDKIDPMPNSPVTAQYAKIIILSDWARKAADFIDKLNEGNAN
jgi:hypothetical protein